MIFIKYGGKKSVESSYCGAYDDFEQNLERSFNDLPLIIYFSYRNVSQNGAKALLKLVLKKTRKTCQKHKIL